ncbi:MAG: hypothetical protein L0Y54_12800 [Sporichthyaceae bacterium]|nr:hypothetical protein [Sporichthyaceae bacterium]
MSEPEAAPLPAAEPAAAPAPLPAPEKRSPIVRLTSWFTGLSGRGKLRVAILAIVAIVAPIALYNGLDDPGRAKAGDCMAGQNEDDLRVVDCSDAAAEWTVLTRLDDKSEADHNEAACSAFPATEASYFQSDSNGDDGLILCLGPK